MLKKKLFLILQVLMTTSIIYSASIQSKLIISPTPALNNATTIQQLTSAITGKTAPEIAAELEKLTDDKLSALFSIATGATLASLKSNVPAERHATLLVLGLNNATTTQQLATAITGKTAIEISTALEKLTDDRLLVVFSIATGATLTTLKSNIPATRHATLLFLTLNNATTTQQLATAITGKTAIEISTALEKLTDNRLLVVFSIATGATLTTLKSNIPATRHATLLVLALNNATTTQQLAIAITGKTAIEIGTALEKLTSDRLSTLFSIATGTTLTTLKNNPIPLLVSALNSATNTQQLTSAITGKSAIELGAALNSINISIESLTNILLLVKIENLQLFKNQISDKKLALTFIKDLLKKHEQTAKDIPLSGQNLKSFTNLKATLDGIKTAIDNDNIGVINTLITEEQGNKYFNWEQGVYNNRNIIISGYPSNYNFLAAKINQYRKDLDRVFLDSSRLRTLMKNAPTIL
jgi:hypothetical protein